LIIAPLALVPITIIKILRYKKVDGRLHVTTALGGLVLLVSLGVSRAFYFVFDIILTNFEPWLYYTQPALSIQKAAMLTILIGLSFLVYTMDAQLFQLKAKGAVSYSLLSAGVLIVFFPVSSMEAYQFTSILESFLMENIFVFLIIAWFVHGGKMRPARLGSFLVAFGLITYAAGSIFFSRVFIAVFGTGTAITIASIIQSNGFFLCAAGFYAYPTGTPKMQVAVQKEATAESASVEPPQELPASPSCASCGEPFPSDSDRQFCPNCGAKILH